MSDVGIFPLTGPLAQAEVNMTATAAKIPSSPLAGRRLVMIRNTGSSTVYLGDDVVNSETGFPMYAKEVADFLVEEGLDLYGICDGGETSTVRVLEIAG